MLTTSPGRRSFLKAMGSAGMLTALPEAANSLYAGDTRVVHEIAQAGENSDAKPQYSIRFSVIGLDHYHIMSMTAALIRGGGELVSFYATSPKAIADFLKLYPQARLASGEVEILNDPTIKLVAGAPIPNLRAPLGVRVMRHGKDYLSDKPAITDLDQLAEVRKTIAQTGRIFAIMYSERLEVRAAVKAGDLIRRGRSARSFRPSILRLTRSTTSPGQTGSGTLTSMAAFYATSARIRPISLSITRVQLPRQLPLRR